MKNTSITMLVTSHCNDHTNKNLEGYSMLQKLIFYNRLHTREGIISRARIFM
jgi:hypothetical protein